MSSPFVILRHPLLGTPPDPFSIYVGGDLSNEPDDLLLKEVPVEKAIVVSINKESQSIKMNAVSPKFSKMELEEHPEREKSCCQILFSIFCCCLRPKRSAVVTEFDYSSTRLTIRVDGTPKPTIEIHSAEEMIAKFSPDLKKPEFNSISQADLAKATEASYGALALDIREDIISWRQNMIKDMRLPSPQACNWLLTFGLNYPECRIIKALLLKKENVHYIPFLTKESKHVLHFVSSPKGSPIFESLHKGSSRPSSPTFALSF